MKASKMSSPSPLPRRRCSARAAVDQQEAALALIIPENFTQAALTGEKKPQLALYQDPTLSFGPGITREMVDQFLDALSGGQIAVTQPLIAIQISRPGADPAMLQQVQASNMATGSNRWLPRRPGICRSSSGLPNKETPKSIGGSPHDSLMGPVMAGMMIFFVFFTGANTAQSIIKEQEEGTLARMFTTPTPLGSILGGKFAAVFMTLIVQSLVLIVASAVVFKHRLGQPDSP